MLFFSRFVNLNWDRGWGFHPDENNLWSSSRQINIFQNQLDPQFYAYGGFPIYLYSLLPNKVAARAVSATCQVLIVLLLYLISKQLTMKQFSNLAMFCTLLAVFSAGLVQAAHFLTVESLIGLFSLLLLYFLLLAYNNYKSYKFYNLYLLLAAVSFGLGLSTKLSFVTFALPFFGCILNFYNHKNSADTSEPRSHALARHARRACEQASVLWGALLISIFIFISFNPFIFVSWKNFYSTLLYESNVATGHTPVFYTRQFVDTIPGLFQMLHVFPFIVSWAFVPLFLIGTILLTKSFFGRSRFFASGKNRWSVRTRQQSLYEPQPKFAKANSKMRRARTLILLFSVTSALLSFLFFSVKWTRYVVQVLPILIIPAGLALSALWQKSKLGRLITLISLITLTLPFLSILSVYLFPDTRLAAADWAAVNIPENSKIFSESYDLGIIPFNPKFQNNITLFNFYEFDDHSGNARQSKLDNLIQNSDYFISVSERVWGNSLAHPDKFPASAEFYRQLFAGSLGYQKVFSSHSEESATKNLVKRYKLFFSSSEETFSVFDNPSVMIFKKVSHNH